MEQIQDSIKSIEIPKKAGTRYEEYHQKSVCDPDCQICNGHGFVRVDRSIYHPRFGKLEPCPNLDPIKFYGTRIGLNEKEIKFRWKSLLDFNKVGEAMTEVKKILDLGHGWLFLWGEFGLGKTTLLKTAIAESLRAGRQSSYTRMVDIIDDLRSAYSTENPSEASANRLEYWTDVPVLAIDEFDRIRLTEYAAERRFALMDHRYENALREKSVTIMASNSDPSDLDGYLADRIFDGRFKIIHLTGNSFRPNLGE